MEKLRNDVVKQALRDLALKESAYYDSLEDPPFTLSETFEKKMDHLMRKQKSWTWPLIKTTKRKVITILVTTLLLFSLSLGITAVRESVFSFFVEMHEKFNTFFTQEEHNQSSSTIKEKYVIKWLPENCKLENQTIRQTRISTTWSCGEQKISFYQLLNSSTKFAMDNEVDTYSKHSINDIETYYISKNGTQVFLWTKDDYSFRLQVPAELDWDTCVKIIESITVEE
ncbi:MAG: DUF4367 domain-containing protein [Clostridia bacterium]|nr:DUF4367 domain-containing protein [Clostridia bacterium]